MMNWRKLSMRFQMSASLLIWRRVLLSASSLKALARPSTLPTKVRGYRDSVIYHSRLSIDLYFGHSVTVPNSVKFVPVTRNLSSSQGRVDLKSPKHKFWLMETDDYGSNNNGLPPVARKRIFFGREVGVSDRSILPTYQLKSRTYLGPTAMDAEMAFLMANQGLARPGSIVFDPFVGTGSILVAAAHFGALTMVCCVYINCAV